MFEIKPSSRFVLKKRCLFVVLVFALFIILVDVGITALLLYYINVSKVRENSIHYSYYYVLPSLNDCNFIYAMAMNLCI